MPVSIDMSDVALAPAPRTYAKFITNTLYICGEDDKVYITLPSDWVMYLGLAAIKAEDGEVEFSIMHSGRHGVLHICYSQGGSEWISIAEITTSRLKAQAAWILERIREDS